MSAPTPQKPQIERQYKDLAKEARASAKQDRAVFWHRSVLKGARCLVRNDAKAYWRFIKSVSGQGRAGSLEGFCFLPNITCVCLPVAPGVSRE